MTGGLLASVAAHGIPGSAVELPSEPCSQYRWRRLLGAAVSARLTGLLASAVVAGRFPLTAEQEVELEVVHREALALALVLDLELVSFGRRLDLAGIEFRVLKGTATAHLDYPDPSLRLFGDVDLLVHPGELAGVIAQAGADGYVRQSVEPRPGFDARFGKGVALARKDGIELDLHRTLVGAPFGMAVDIADLWSGRQAFTVGERTLYALSRECRLVHACLHASLGNRPPRLLVLRDVAELLTSALVDPARVIDLARRWRVGAVVADAIGHACSALQLTDDTELTTWAAAFEPDRWEAAALRRATVPDATYGALCLTSLRHVPGLREKAAYLRAVALPDHAHVAGRRMRRLGNAVQAVARR